MKMDRKKVQGLVRRKDGTLIPLDRFSWDEKTKIFSSRENNLTVNFTGIDNCTIIVSEKCKVFAGNNCTIISGGRCDFETGDNCTFYAEPHCVFKTRYDLCKHYIGPVKCTYNEKYGCAFKNIAKPVAAWSNYTLKTGDNCKIIRKDTGEIINPPLGQRIKLNDSGGYQIVE